MSWEGMWRMRSFSNLMKKMSPLQVLRIKAGSFPILLPNNSTCFELDLL